MNRIAFLLVLFIGTIYTFAVDSIDAGISVGDTFKFNYDDAFRMATISAASYCTQYESSPFNTWDCVACKDSGVDITDMKSLYISLSHSNVLVGYSSTGGGRIVVAFTGVNPVSWRNWALDIDTFMIGYSACKGCEVQADFFNAYVETRRDILNLLSSLKDKWPDAPVYITGHGVGGALATHLIADLYNHAFSVTTMPGGGTMVSGGNPAYEASPAAISPEEAVLLGGTVTTTSFEILRPAYIAGSPRIANPAFSDWFQRTVGATGIWRLTHLRDPVPHAPSALDGFMHVGTEVYFDAESKHRICAADAGESPDCSNAYRFDLDIDDHGVYAGYKFAPSWDTCN